MNRIHSIVTHDWCCMWIPSELWLNYAILHIIFVTCVFIHSSWLTFILVTVVVDPELPPGSLGARREYTHIHYRATCAHTHIGVGQIHLLLACFWEGRKKPDNPTGNPCGHDENGSIPDREKPSSGLIQELWNCEATTLPVLPPICNFYKL